MHRYIALIWDRADHESTKRVHSTVADIVASQHSWEVAYESDGIAVLHNLSFTSASHAYLLSDGQGVVLGSLFCRTTPVATKHQYVRIDASETQRILDSKGRHLVDSYWGSYVAFAREQKSGSCSVLRDPIGNLSCYHAKWERVQAFFSDMEDFQLHIPMPLSVNWEHISARLLAGWQLSPECALREIEDVPGGQWITFSADGERRSVLWHPKQFCLDGGLDDEQTAARELRAAVLNATRALCAQHSRILLRLSGGLDSSIIATCLAQLEDRPEVTCLNFYTPSDGSGEGNVPVLAPGLSTENLAKLRRLIGAADEREFARSVARRCGYQLIEKEKRVQSFDFRQIWSTPPAPRPSNYIFVLDEDAAESEVAAESRATACFTGEAGDTVLYCTFRAIGALDYAYLHPFGSRLLAHAAATSTLSHESIGRVLWKAMKYGLLRVRLPSPFDPMKRPHLLRDDAAANVPPDYFHHPWLSRDKGLCPGKRNHIAGVARSVPYYHHVFKRERIAPSVHPLASQPVVEMCLRIPTYVLLADGISRGLARRAFQDVLPPEVSRRTVKGASISYWQQLVRKNVAFFRHSLLDGLLVREGLLDARKLNDYLVEDQSFLTVQALQIMDYLGCEVWLRQRAATRPCRIAAQPARVSEGAANVHTDRLSQQYRLRGR